MSKSDATVAQTIPTGILVSVDTPRKAERPTPTRKPVHRVRAGQVPWLSIVTAGSLCWALLIVVVGVCTSGSAPEQASEPVHDAEPVAQAAPEFPKAVADEERIVVPKGDDDDAEIIRVIPAKPNVLARVAPVAHRDEQLVEVKFEPLILEERTEAAAVKPQIKPNQARMRPDVDLKVFANCQQIGTNVLFVKNPPDAFKRAKAENKLVFMVHLSGNLEDPDFT